MALQILKYPNPILKKKSTQVKEFDENLHKILDDMYETLMESSGIGLAAIQVGIQKRIFLINLYREEDELRHKEDLLEIINPVFLKKENAKMNQEGCLSVPDFYEEIERFSEVSIAYQNRYGEEKILKADGLLAIALQHENDHLDGILFIDKLPLLRRKKFEKELKRIQKEERNKK